MRKGNGYPVVGPGAGGAFGIGDGAIGTRFRPWTIGSRMCRRRLREPGGRRVRFLLGSSRRRLQPRMRNSTRTAWRRSWRRGWPCSKATGFLSRKRNPSTGCRFRRAFLRQCNGRRASIVRPRWWSSPATLPARPWVRPTYPVELQRARWGQATFWSKWASSCTKSMLAPAR